MHFESIVDHIVPLTLSHVFGMLVRVCVSQLCAHFIHMLADFYLLGCFFFEVVVIAKRKFNFYYNG